MKRTLSVIHWSYVVERREVYEQMGTSNRYQSTRHTVNSSHMRLVTQPTRHKRAHNKGFRLLHLHLCISFLVTPVLRYF